MKSLSTLLLLIFLMTMGSIGNAVEEPRGFKKIVEERRIALVIGNGDYDSSPLRNPTNDAEDMTKILNERGFAVTSLIDSDKRTMVKAIHAFGQDLKKGGVGLFYYAGHGMQVNGRNYLIPIGAMIEVESDIEFESVDVGRVLANMANANNRLNMVILDACRDNPFARSFRSSAKGLAQMDAPTGTLIAYATAPGRTAADGNERNGIYTKYLLEQAKVPGMEISQMFKQVRAKVREETDGKQIPWEATSLEGNFYFTPSEEKASTTISPVAENSSSATVPSPASDASNSVLRQATSAEIEMWNLIKDSKDVTDFEDFLVAFPNGKYAALAKLKLKRKQQQRKINYVPKDFILVKTGSFQMGSKTGYSNERPAHTVNITRPFYIADHETTVSEYQKFVEATGYREPKCSSYENWGKSGRENSPINCVSWGDAQAYIRWLNINEGAAYRLCTEAEWEYAARAGTTMKWGCGNNEACLEETNPDSESLLTNLFQKGTPAVKSKKPNAWKIYDMNGSLWEWVEDWYGPYSEESVNNPTGPESGTYRVRRGGGFTDNSSKTRSAVRDYISPDARIKDLGFRLCHSK